MLHVAPRCSTLLHVAPFGRRSTFFVWAMSEIFSLWVSSWQELHKLSNSSHVLRDWLTKTTTATISTTMTSTSTTATTSTSTRLVKQFPTPLHSSGLLLGALELAFSDPLEVWGYDPDWLKCSLILFFLVKHGICRYSSNIFACICWICSTQQFLPVCMANSKCLDDSR